MARSGDTDEATREIWGTWEDLLLACAVNRHGISNWDSVAVEVQSRSPFSHLLTSTSCRLRYFDLHRRFSTTGLENGAPAAAVSNSDEGGDLDPSDSGAWVEELRKQRVAELRREVERYDLSIVNLELKVNRLKEEREHSTTKESSDPSGGDGKQEPTAEDQKDEDRSPGSTAAEISSRSCKESNSTDLKEDKQKQGDDSGTGVDTCTDRTAGETGKRDGESGESVADSKESSDLQSSASLSTRRRMDASSSEVETETKSQPLVAFLEILRSDKSGSVFERRLESQESERYKSTIKRHMDLETIKSKLELPNSHESSYTGSTEFYRDLLLLCTNALLFFPKSSPEYTSALNLRSIVNKEISSANLFKPRVSSPSSSSHKEAALTDIIPTVKPDPDPNSTPLLEKPTIIMCRKRSSLTKPVSQTASSSGTLKEDKERQVVNTGLVSDPDPNTKKTSSTRGPRTNKTRTNTTLHSLNPNPKQEVILDKDKDKNSSDKKRHAVDFLNRLNQSGPATSSSKSDGKKGSKKSTSPPGKRNVGRPPKRPGSSLTPPQAKRFKEEGGSKKRRGGRR